MANDDGAGKQKNDRVGYQTRSLTRALAILDAFTPERRTLSVKDLHSLLTVPKPTVSRLASELQKAGYLRSTDQGYELGPRIFELGLVFDQQYHLQELARPLLQELAQNANLTACMGILDGPEIIHICVAPSPRPVAHVTAVGTRSPAHATAMGKALLACAPADAVERALGEGPLPKSTPKTISSPAALRRELEAIRERGYSIDDEETAVGLACVATALELSQVGATAISVSGPAADFDGDTISSLGREVRATATKLRAALSGSHNGALEQSA